MKKATYTNFLKSRQGESFEMIVYLEDGYIKPLLCPFCGCKNITVIDDYQKKSLFNKERFMFCCCETCGAKGPCVSSGKTFFLESYKCCVKRWIDILSALKCRDSLALASQIPVSLQSAFHMSDWSYYRSTGLKYRMPLGMGKSIVNERIKNKAQFISALKDRVFLRQNDKRSNSFKGKE